MSCFKLPKYLIHEIEGLIARFWWGGKNNSKKIHWVKWETLCDSKRDGGLGFRDLEVFNKALLGKQIWKIVREPHSLLSQILSAKYFPNGNIFEAKKPSLASFTWKSLFGVLLDMKKGFRWRIGNGKKVPIWNSPWLPRDHNLTINTPNFFNLQNSFVCDLIDPNFRNWDHSLLDSLFWHDDAASIRSIPIPPSPSDDILIWHYAPNGSYSVKCGYRFFCNLAKVESFTSNAGPSHLVTQPSWNFLWALKIPSKIRIFVWRLLRNSLPIRPNLLKRGITTDLNCCFCSSHSETIEHLFFSCPFARLWWALSGIPYHLICVVSHDFLLWFLQVRKKLDDNLFERFVFFCWSLWSQRNRKIHGESLRDPAAEAQFLMKYIEDCRRTWNHPHRVGRTTEWKPPQEDFIKINFDAAFAPHSGAAMAAAVARNNSGRIICWKTRKMIHGGSAENAETFAAWHAILLARDAGWKHIIIEGDCWNVICFLQSTEPVLSLAGPIVDECRNLKQLFSEIQFAHINREGNLLAHRLAAWADDDFEGTVLPFS